MCKPLQVPPIQLNAEGLKHFLKLDQADSFDAEEQCITCSCSVNRLYVVQSIRTALCDGRTHWLWRNGQVNVRTDVMVNPANRVLLRCKQSHDGINERDPCKWVERNRFDLLSGTMWMIGYCCADCHFLTHSPFSLSDLCCTSYCLILYIRQQYEWTFLVILTDTLLESLWSGAWGYIFLITW